LPLISSSSSSGGGVTITKPTQNLYIFILHGQTACTQLLIAEHCSQQKLQSMLSHALLAL